MSPQQQSSADWAMGGRRIARPRAANCVGDLADAGKVATKVAVKGKTMTDVLAGGIARAASQSTIHPLDTLKVRMQVKRPGAAAPTVAPKTAPAVVSAGKYGVGAGTAKPNLMGVTSSAASRVTKQLGSLYKGVGGAASGAGIAIGTYFAFYGATSRALQENTNLSLPTIAFLAGAAGAIGGSIVKVPAAVMIRSVQANLYPNVIVAGKSIVKKAGIKGLFTGYLPTLIEDVPDMAVKFAAYESMRQMHSKVTGREKTEKHEDLIIGGVAGALAAGSTTPLDVIKTRMMVCAGSGLNAVTAAKQIFADGGAKGFMLGCGPRTLSNFINSGIFFVFYEAIRVAIEEQEKRWATATAAKEQARMERAVAAKAEAAKTLAALPLHNLARAHNDVAAPAGGFESDELDSGDILCISRGGNRIALAAEASLSRSIAKRSVPVSK